MSDRRPNRSVEMCSWKISSPLSQLLELLVSSWWDIFTINWLNFWEILCCQRALNKIFLGNPSSETNAWLNGLLKVHKVFNNFQASNQNVKLLKAFLEFTLPSIQSVTWSFKTSTSSQNDYSIKKMFNDCQRIFEPLLSMSACSWKASKLPKLY